MKDDDIYFITSEDEFISLSKYVNRGNDCEEMTFKIKSDIDLSEIKNWTPIHTFNGIFDGRNHKINNLTIKIRYSNSNNECLFGYVGNSKTVKNINLLSANVAAGNDVGEIAGRNAGIISNCNFTGIRLLEYWRYSRI